MLEELKHTYQHMLYELETNCLEVILVTPPKTNHVGHMMRMVSNRNPYWYRELCSRFQSSRKGRKGKYKKHGDTRIKRQHILYLLRCLADGRSINSKYKDSLEDIAKVINKNILADAGCLYE